jgi:serine/threonine protein phosphatase PrpC
MASGPGAGVVAVFDGLGGAGSAEVETSAGRQTQARLASRFAFESLVEFVGRGDVHPVPEAAFVGEPYPAVAREFAEALRARLLGEVDRLGLGASRIRSKMIRTLPTTVAVGRYGRTAGGRVRVEAIWAGDSRVYLLAPGIGLQQLTEDDVRSRGDALANIREDSPMTNVVSASGPFVLNVRTVEDVSTPVVVLAATDGCFGYLPTPWHFEHLLLEALDDARDPGRWRHEIAERIAEITGDDLSMGMALVGVESFGELKSAFRGRHRHLVELVKKHNNISKRYHQLDRAHERLKAEFGSVESEQWGWYRDAYERPLRGVERRTAQPRSPADMPAAHEPSGSVVASLPSSAAPDVCLHCGSPLLGEGSHP